MNVHPLAGRRAPSELLINLPHLMSSYYVNSIDPENPAHLVSFGTSGHRGSSLKNSFNEAHILAISQAICDYRKAKGIDGPLFLAKDTHGLSEAAFITAIEVFAANSVEVMVDENLGFTPTPVVSHAILSFNQGQKTGLSDGVIITPSHNPPEDGGFKYNPPSGGPAGTSATKIIQDRANEILKQKLNAVKRIPYQSALKLGSTYRHNYIQPYVKDLKNVINFNKLFGSSLKIGVDPLGGSGIAYWNPIADEYNLNLELVNNRIDATFAFMHVDRDGKVRMDCSSPYAMAGLIKLKDKYDISFANDPDYDRHGIVTRGSGLLNPNHYLSVAVWYLFQNRPDWPAEVMVGKTLVSSSMIDRVAASLNRRVYEVPVGFKWFVDGLQNSRCGFGGEESAGAAFLRKNSEVWTTDKDGIIMDLLAAEITAESGRDPGEIYDQLAEKFGNPVYQRMDAPASQEQKEILKNMKPDLIKDSDLAGEKILAKLTNAPGNNAPLGGLKVVTENGWFAARPSGTEEIYKIYAESFKGEDHLKQIQNEAISIVDLVFKASGL